MFNLKQYKLAMGWNTAKKITYVQAVVLPYNRWAQEDPQVPERDQASTPATQNEPHSKVIRRNKRHSMGKYLNKQMIGSTVKITAP